MSDFIVGYTSRVPGGAWFVAPNVKGLKVDPFYVDPPGICQTPILGGADMEAKLFGGKPDGRDIYMMSASNEGALGFLDEYPEIKNALFGLLNAANRGAM